MLSGHISSIPGTAATTYTEDSERSLCSSLSRALSQHFQLSPGQLCLDVAQLLQTQLTSKMDLTIPPLFSLSLLSHIWHCLPEL